MRRKTKTVKRTRNTLNKRRKNTTETRTVKTVGMKNIDCFMCHEAVKVDTDTRAVLCGTCTMLASGAPAPKMAVKKEVIMEMKNGLPVVVGHRTIGKTSGVKLNKDGTPRKKRSPNGSVVKKVSSGRPRGWHLKKRFVDVDGTVFKFGVSTNKKTVKARVNEAKARKTAKSASKYMSMTKASTSSAKKTSKRGRPKGSKNKPKTARKTVKRKTTTRRK